MMLSYVSTDSRLRMGVANVRLRATRSARLGTSLGKAKHYLDYGSDIRPTTKAILTISPWMVA